MSPIALNSGQQATKRARVMLHRPACRKNAANVQNIPVRGRSDLQKSVFRARWSHLAPSLIQETPGREILSALADANVPSPPTPNGNILHIRLRFSTRCPCRSNRAAATDSVCRIFRSKTPRLTIRGRWSRGCWFMCNRQESATWGFAGAIS